MTKNILLATNGSETAVKAEEHALQLCQCSDVKLTILYVIDENLCHYGKVDTLAPLEARESFIDYVITEQEEVAESIKLELAEKAKQHDATFDFIRKQGDPVEVISKTADQEAMDLIIIGGKRSRRNRGFKSLSVADKLSSQTTLSILTIV